MQINIDWLSFTVRREVGEDDTEQTVLAQVLYAVSQLYEDFWDALQGSQPWEWRSGRKPYRASFARPDGGVAIFLHPALDHALIEISGKGCATLGEWRDPAGLLTGIAPRLTRFDLACDILTETRPLDFVQQRQPGRFTSHSEVVSESGETCYIGSSTSNRYARCYRYNPPHERAHLLRIEYVLKSEDAKSTALTILSDGHEAVAAALGRQFGWQHPEWLVLPPSEVELRAYRPERHEGKTLFWLSDTVAPLLVRLAKEGTIDPIEWFATNVLHILNPPDTL